MRRPANKGARCQKWQRVPGRGGRLRCLKFERRGPFRIGYQDGNIPANRGRVCLRRKRVYSPWYDQTVWRCASYGGRGRTSRKSLFSTSRPKRLSPGRHRDVVSGPSFFQRLFGPMEGRVPLSLPSMERMRAGRTAR